MTEAAAKEADNRFLNQLIVELHKQGVPVAVADRMARRELAGKYLKQAKAFGSLDDAIRAIEIIISSEI